MREITVAIAGNPNAGKTTLFNALTGARQHVGNYPGVTVEKKEGTAERNGIRFRLIDLPGTYSLSANSPEEVVARDFLVKEKPDAVVHVVDASNLDRNLYLTTQLMELGVRLVVALNMVDELHNRGVIVHILDMGIFDNTPMGKLLFTVLAAFAEFEHALIKERLQGGRAWKRATEPDYRDGRKPTYSKEQKAHALQLLEDGDTFKQVTAKTGISRTQLYRLLDEKKEVAQ